VHEPPALNHTRSLFLELLDLRLKHRVASTLIGIKVISMGYTRRRPQPRCPESRELERDGADIGLLKLS